MTIRTQPGARGRRSTARASSAKRRWPSATSFRLPYTLSEIPPAGFIPETKSAGAGGGTTSIFMPGVIGNISLTAGENATGYIFADIPFIP